MGSDHVELLKAALLSAGRGAALLGFVDSRPSQAGQQMGLPSPQVRVVDGDAKRGKQRVIEQGLLPTVLASTRRNDR